MTAEIIIPYRAPRSLSALNEELPALFLPSEKAAERFFDFFTANIRNKNTRRAYYRAACRFADWCEGRELGSLAEVKPIHVAGYVEALQGDCPSLPSSSTWQRCACSSTGWWSAMCLR
jgi:site-specific recombinase XerD